MMKKREVWISLMAMLCACNAAFAQSHETVFPPTCAAVPVQLQPAGHTSDYGILRSTDNGATWSKVVNDSGGVQAIVRTPTGRILAGTLGALTGQSLKLGLMISDDGGKTWGRISSCPNGVDLSDLRSFLALPDGRLLGGAGSGIYHSDNNADCWVQMNRGLGPGAGSNVQSLAVTDKGEAFAATYDGMSRWDKTSGRWLPAGLKGIPLNALVATQRGTLVAGSGGKGIYRSPDKGITWKPASVGSGRVWVSALAADSKGRLYAGVSAFGVYRSDDDGISWKRLAVPATKPQVYALATTEHDIFVAIGGCCPVNRVGLFRSSDSSSTWRKVFEEHDSDVAISAILADSQGTLLVGLGTVGD